MSVDATKLIVRVTAGLTPFEEDPAFSRQWTISSADWQLAEQADAELLQQAQEGDPAAAGHAYHAALKLAFTAAEADEYARLLRNPGRFNFVRTDWIWL